MYTSSMKAAIAVITVALASTLSSSPALAVSSAGCLERSPKRSAAAVRAFRKEHPCPATGKTRGACPLFEIDHIAPLCCGGDDDPSNMHWLTKAEHKAKHAGGIVCEIR